MDYIGTLKKSFNVWKSNKFLWILGLFLTTSSFSGSSFSSFKDSDLWQNNSLTQMGSIDFQAIIPIIICVALFSIILSIVFTYLDLRANVSLIKSAEKLDKGEELNFKKAWELGGSNKLSLFIINILVSIPIVILITLLVVFFAIVGSAGKAESLVFLICGCIALAIVPLVLLAIYLSLIKEIAYRIVVIENKGAIDALRESASVVKNNFKEYFISLLMVSVVNSIISTALGFIMILVIIGPAILAIPVIVSMQSQAGLLFLIPLFLLVIIAVVLISLLSGPLASFINVLWTNLYLRIKELKN